MSLMTWQAPYRCAAVAGSGMPRRHNEKSFSGLALGRQRTRFTWSKYSTQIHKSKRPGATRPS